MKQLTINRMAAIIMMMAASIFFFIGCNTEEIDPNTPIIGVDQTIVDIPAGGGDITLTVTANRSWKLTDNITGEKWIIADKAEGEGDAVITLTVAPNTGVSREADLRIATSTVYVDVRVTQPGTIATEVIYYEDMGKTNVTANTNVAAHTGWSKEGSGGGSVAYSSSASVTIRTTNNSADAYDGASGGNNVFFGGGAPNHFIVSGIALSGVDNIALTFGAHKVDGNGSWAAFVNSDLNLFYSSDNGANWQPVNWTSGEPASGKKWALASAQIPTTGVSSLSLKWECTIASVVRIDDIKAISYSGAPSDLSVSPTSLNFVAAGEAKSFTITSAKAWTVTSSATWCPVSPTSGSNNATINVTTLANDGAQRTATITVTTTDNSTTRTVAVTQAAVEASETPQTYLSENWESGTAGTGQSAAINGWTFEKVLGNDDKKFELRTFNNNKYAYASAHNGTAADYEFWLISPALDISGAASKVVSFKTVGGYFQATSSLEVYILNSKAAGTATDTKLTAKIAEATDVPSGGTYTDWISSGDIDLSAYSGTKYIGFRYVAKGGVSNSTTYEIDDFLFGAAAPKELAVNPASLSFVAAGEQKSFTITSNTAWTATSSETWCSVSPASGSNDGAVTVTATANTSTQSRSATITVNGTGATDKTIAVTQAGSGGGGTSFAKIEWDFTTITTTATVTSLVSTEGNGTLTTTANSGSFTAHTGDYATASTWTGGNKAWIMEIPITGGFTGGSIKLSYNAYSSGTGPRDFAVEWSADGNSWSTATDAEKYALPSATKDSKVITITPSGLSDKLYIRLRVASNISARAGTGTYSADEAIAGSGTNRISDFLTVEQQ